MDILKYMMCAKKGVNCLFRKLLCKEEVEGRSLGWSEE